MKIKIVTIDVPVPRALRIALPLGVLLAISGGAFAALEPPFVDNEVLSAAKLNANFRDLDARIRAISGPGGGSEWAVLLGSSCSVLSSSSGWLSASGSRGSCSAGFASGTFSAPPACFGTSYGSRGSFSEIYVVKVNDVSVAGARFIHEEYASSPGVSSAAAGSDEPFAVFCAGPR